VPLKKRKSNIFFKKKYALKCHENAFLLLALWKKNIYSRIWNWIRNFLLVKEDPDPDPKLGRKWDPDPKKIVSDPQHWRKAKVRIPVYKMCAECRIHVFWCELPAIWSIVCPSSPIANHLEKYQVGKNNI
jgi:hypothetical protein